MTLISIIMPVYNCENYLKEQLDSLLSQTFSDFELLIVNDGSTDSTMSILSEYACRDNRISIYNNEFSKGIAGGLNTALKYAKSKYIARSDGDDVHTKNRLEIQYEFLESHPAIDIIGGRSLLFNKDGIIRKSVYPESSIELAWKFISNTYFCHPSVMFRSSVYKELGGYPNETSEDFAYFSKIIKSHQGANLPQILLNYRIHDKSYSAIDSSTIDTYIYNKFKENYAYYVPDLKMIDEFRLFHVREILSPAYFFKMLSINTKILNKIRLDYGMPSFNQRFVLMLFKQLTWLFKGMYSHFKIKLWYFIKGPANRETTKLV